MYSDRVSGATPFRFPSTANLMISSLDRETGTASRFVIQKNNNILSGFFTRFGMVEITLDWCIDNISVYQENTTLTVNIAGTDYIATVFPGQYTVQALLDALVTALNTAAGVAGVFSLSGTIPATGSVFLDCTVNFTVLEGRLQTALNLQFGTAGNSFPVNCPNLLPYTYLDFVCSNLTYQQDLKDSSTAAITRDVIYRWVFGWEGPSPVDGYGYPIFQGMQKFLARRYLSYPKQIKWDAQQPLGQLVFEVYDQNGLNIPIPSEGELEFYMTLLVSEQ